MGYSKDTVKGVGWVGSLRGATRVISFFKIALLARILTPTQFGTFAIASLTLSLLEIFTETGINVFLIQEKDKLEKYINTAWVVSIIRGALISLVLLILSPFVSTFFNSKDSQILLTIIAFVPLVRGFINPSIVRFQKDLAFSKDFFFRISIFVVDAGITTLVAIQTRSASSFCIGLLFGAVLEVILSFLIVKPRPKFVFESDKFSHVLNRGKWLTGAGIFQYFYREGDDILVGKILGSSSLGLYEVAYKIATLPISEVADVVGKVTLPVFVKISSEKGRLRNALRKVELVTLLLSLPAAVFIFIFSEQILLIGFGPNWVSAKSALQAVAIYALLRSLINPSLTLFLALKKQEYLTFVTLNAIIGMLLFIIPLMNMYGILGAGIATIIGITSSLPLTLHLRKKTINSL